MHIRFDISQTGSGNAGCGHFSHAMITAMLELAPEHRYELFPSSGNFFDALMLILNRYYSDSPEIYHAIHRAAKA